MLLFSQGFQHILFQHAAGFAFKRFYLVIAIRRCQFRHTVNLYYHMAPFPCRINLYQNSVLLSQVCGGCLIGTIQIELCQLGIAACDPNNTQMRVCQRQGYPFYTQCNNHPIKQFGGLPITD
ncbi:Uncharacterised protein [Serratia quinivorans]|nr:Uncharacterised protein [Serratia quinivorans]